MKGGGGDVRKNINANITSYTCTCTYQYTITYKPVCPPGEVFHLVPWKHL